MLKKFILNFTAFGLTNSQPCEILKSSISFGQFVTDDTAFSDYSIVVDYLNGNKDVRLASVAVCSDNSDNTIAGMQATITSSS